MKRFIPLFLIAFLLGVASPAMAEHDGRDGKMCTKCGGESEGSSECPVAEKAMKKAHWLLDNSEELGLTAEQTAQIKEIKMGLKKGGIQEKAGMEMFMIDLKSKLSEETLDVEGLNAMIDGASAQFAKAGKDHVAAYAKLKGILTAEQMVKAKALWKKK